MKKPNHPKIIHPGVLKTNVELTIHTRNAQFVFLGRVSNSQSLFRFDQQVSAIRKAASKDDPYADWVLINIYNALTKTQKAFHELETKLRIMLDSEKGLKLEPAQTKSPAIYNLQLRTQFGRMAARLIATYDRITQCLKACDALEIDSDFTHEIVLEETLAQLKRVLNQPKLWKKMNITRQDIRQNTELAKEAEKIYSALGKLPVDLLKRKRIMADSPRVEEKILNDNRIISLSH